MNRYSFCEKDFAVFDIAPLFGGAKAKPYTPCSAEYEHLEPLKPRKAGEPFAIVSEFDDGMELPIAIFNAAEDFGANTFEDATDAINAALDAAAQLGGGTVYLPSGHYRVSGTVTVPKTVCLRGEWQSPNSAPAGEGTVIIAEGERNSDSVLFSCQSGSTLRNLTVIYPFAGEIRDNGTAMKCEKGTNFNFENLTVLGAWNGIFCGPEWNELYYLHNVYMYCLNIGFFSDNNSDIGRLENVQCDPEFFTENAVCPLDESEKKTVRDWAFEHSVAFRMAKNDWGYQYNILVRGHCCGLDFIHSRNSSGNHCAMNGECMNTVLEDCNIGIRIEQTKIAGIAFTNLVIRSKRAVRAGIETLAPYHGVTQFLNTKIEGNIAYPILSAGSSKENMPGSIKFVGLDISGWDCRLDFAVTVLGGSVTMQNVRFGEKNRHMLVTDNAYSVSVLGASFPQNADFCIDEAAMPRVQLDYGEIPCTYPENVHVYRECSPRPASDLIYCVTDFGANGENEDNTAAFSAALNAASKTGGTVYAPGKAYKIRGHLTVPEGVELRGCWNGQYMTEHDGTYLLAYDGYNCLDGEPFITMKKNSGLRGLTVFYPEQSHNGMVPFPWTVKGEGEGIWAVWLDIANAYKGIDLAENNCDNHYIDWVVGSPLTVGVYAGNSKTQGWVQNVHFNPNFGRCRFAGVSGKYKELQLYECEAIKIGDCLNEHIFNSFVYGSRYGLGFVSQGGGGAKATVIGHATDGSENGIIVYEAQRVEIINAQTTTMTSTRRKRNIAAEKDFTGTLLLFNCVGYGPKDTMEQIAVDGGTVISNLYGFISGHGTWYATVSAGKLFMNSSTFDRRERFVKISGKAECVELIGNYCRPFEAIMKIDENTSDALIEERLSWFA